MTSPPENPSPWQEADMDVLGIVVHHVNSLPDTARMGAVCRAWRRAVTNLHPPLPPQMPWLLLPDLKLCSLSSDGATAAGHRLPQPEAAGGAVPICVGSSYDGRVILLQEERCFLLNPLSGVTNRLPDLRVAAGPSKRFPGPFVNAATTSNPIKPCNLWLPRKVVMSCPPDSGSACIMAGMSDLGLSCGFEPLLESLERPYQETNQAATLFLCRPGGATWSVTPISHSWSKSDFVFHNGELYLFRNQYPQIDICTCDVAEDDDGTLKVTRYTVQPSVPPLVFGTSAFFYFIESRGKLLLVQRYIRERRTQAVVVFAMNESKGRPEWARMGRSLDGEIVFLSANSSLSVPSSRYRGGDARGDRIYFGQEMDVGIDGCPRGRDCPYQHCEVFDMRTRRAETLCMGTAPGHDSWSAGPTWFLPCPPKHGNAN